MEDALSRYANLLSATASSRCETYLEDKIRNEGNIKKDYQKLKEKTTENEVNRVKTDVSMNKKGLLLHKRRVNIPNSEEIKLIIMDDLHKIPYSGHPR